MSFISNFDPVLRVPRIVSCHSDLDNYNVASFKYIKAALVGELSERMMSDAFGGGDSCSLGCMTHLEMEWHLN